MIRVQGGEGRPTSSEVPPPPYRRDIITKKKYSHRGLRLLRFFFLWSRRMIDLQIL